MDSELSVLLWLGVFTCSAVAVAALGLSLIALYISGEQRKQIERLTMKITDLHQRDLRRSAEAAKQTASAEMSTNPSPVIAEQSVISSLTAPKIPVSEQLPKVAVEVSEPIAAIEEISVSIPAIEEQPAVAQQPVSSVPPEQPPAVVGSFFDTDQPPSPRAPLSPERIVVWVAAALGGLTLVLTAIFGIAVVVERGWFNPTPAQRVATAFILGSGLWGVGTWLNRRTPLVSAALVAIGVVTVYTGCWASAAYWQLLPMFVAGGLMAAVTTVGYLSAIRLRSRLTAHLTLIGAVILPLLLSTGSDNAVGYFSWLFMISLGILAGATRRQWADVSLHLALWTCGVFATWTITHYVGDQVLTALISVAALSIPYLVHGKSKFLGNQAVGIGTALVLGYLAVPWVWPVDAIFEDPVSHIQIVKQVDYVYQITGVAFAVNGIPFLIWAFLRSHRWRAALAGSLVSLPLMLVSSIGWTVISSDSPPIWLPLLAWGWLIPAWIWAGVSRSGHGLSLQPIGSAFAWAFGAVSLSAGPAALGVAVPALLGTLLSRASQSPWLLLVFLFANAISLHIFGVRVYWETDNPLAPDFVAGLTLIAFAFSGRLPLLFSWQDQTRGPWMAAAWTAPLLALPLGWCWAAAWGVDFIGLLPLLLAMESLLLTVVYIRRARPTDADLLMGVWVGLVLLGLSAAIPLQLDTKWLTVTWAVEALALAIVSRRLTHPLIYVTSVLLGIAVAIRLLVNPWALAWGDASGWPILNWTLWTWGIPFLTLLGQAKWLRRDSERSEIIPTIFVILSLCVGFGLVNVQVSDLFQTNGPIALNDTNLFQGMVRSGSWAVYGLVVLMAGLITNRRFVRFIGFSFMMLATAKVFLVDLWILSGLARVGSLACLGISLLIAAFLFERLVLRRTSSVETPK